MANRVEGNGNNRQPVIRIECTITGDLAQQAISVLSSGYFTTKPELVRQALRLLFAQLDEKQLQRKRLELLDN